MEEQRQYAILFAAANSDPQAACFWFPHQFTDNFSLALAVVLRECPGKETKRCEAEDSQRPNGIGNDTEISPTTAGAAPIVSVWHETEYF
jgi:hypothetical protein